VFRSALCGLAILLGLFGAPALAATVLYLYDDLGRLIAEIDPAGDATRYTYDAAGNLLSVTRDSSTGFRVDGFSPSSGRVGDAVTLFGAGFIADPAQNTVSFNGTPATITLATPHSLVAAVPSGATTGPITVSNANGSATTAQAFTVIAAPAIVSVSPFGVSRGDTTQVEINGLYLDSATSVTFSQPGFNAQIVARTPAKLTIHLSVAGTVPFGSYVFSVANFAGTSESGSVTVTVTTALVGSAMSVARGISVHLPAVTPGAPAGNAMSVPLNAVSVHLPAPIPGAPAGNALSVAQPMSVHLAAPISGAPAGSALSAAAPLSVNLPAIPPGAPDGNALGVAQPTSVLRP
jgi:YD repeat-containing protein